MEIKKNVALIVGLMMIFTLFTLNTFAETKLKQLNRYPLMKVPSKGIKNVDDFKALVEKYADRIKDGFGKTTEASLYDDFMTQVRSGNIEERVIPKGQNFKWMLFYSKKQPKVAYDVEWAGKTTVNAYAVSVVRNRECKKYEFLIPRVCGNIGLVEEAGGEVICNIELKPKEVQVDETVTVDMSDSQCAVAYEITVNREGNPVETKKLSAGEKSWQTSFKDPGVYEFTAVALNTEGIASKNECKASVRVNPVKEEVAPQQQPVPPRSTAAAVEKRLFILAEAGPMIVKGTYTTYIFARIGLAYYIIPEKLSFIASGGAGINLGSDIFKTHFLSNLLLNVHFEKFFVGAGIGFSSKVRDAMIEDGIWRPEWKSNIDIVGNVGYEIFSKPNNKGFIFGEIRIPIHKGLEFKVAHAFLLGFRFLF